MSGSGAAQALLRDRGLNASYLIVGPYFALGWVTKGIEVAIVLLVLADLLIGTDAGHAARRPPRSA